MSYSRKQRGWRTRLSLNPRKMKNYFLLQHQRGNHSAQQVYFHGKTILNGTKKECEQEIARMKKQCKKKWHETSTNSKISDFVSYEMADIFFVKKKGDEINWA